MTTQKKNLSKLKYIKSKLIVWYYTKVYKLFSGKLDTEYLQFKAGIIAEKSMALQRLQKASKIVLEYESALSNKQLISLNDHLQSLPKVSISSEIYSSVSQDTMDRHKDLAAEMHRKEEVLKTMVNESSSEDEIETAIDVVFFNSRKAMEKVLSADSISSSSAPKVSLSSKPEAKTKKPKTNKPKMKVSPKEPKITKK